MCLAQKDNVVATGWMVRDYNKTHTLNCARKMSVSWKTSTWGSIVLYKHGNNVRVSYDHYWPVYNIQDCFIIIIVIIIIIKHNSTTEVQGLNTLYMFSYIYVRLLVLMEVRIYSTIGCLSGWYCLDIKSGFSLLPMCFYICWYRMLAMCLSEYLDVTRPRCIFLCSNCSRRTRFHCRVWLQILSSCRSA